MCGRMLIFTYDEVRDILRSLRGGPENPYPDWPARRPINAYPQSQVPALGAPDGQEPLNLRWGFLVQWQAGPVFNTRVESIVRGSGMWREPAENGRCLVPTRGFFERHESQTVRSKKTGRQVKRPYFFELVDEPITWLAGVSDGQHLSIVTTEPNRFVAPVHKRMPLVLRRKELPLWVAGEFTQLADRSDVELLAEPEDSREEREGEAGDQLSLF